MKKVVFGVLLSLVLVGNCYGFETGTWSTKNGDVQGKLQVKKQGSDYVTSIEVFEETRPGFSGGICEENLRSKEVNKELQVFNGNNMSFVFKKEGKNYRMIPKDMSGYSHCGDEVDYGNEDLMKLRWKKVK